MKRFDQINMVPFIDVMLVLLAIVLTTATFVSQGLIEVNLPTAGQVSEPDVDVEPLEIAIDAENKLYFQGEALELEALGVKLDTVNPEQLLVLRIDKDARFEHFIKLVDMLKTKDLNNLSIQAQQDQGGPEAAPDQQSLASPDADEPSSVNDDTAEPTSTEASAEPTPPEKS